MYFSHFTAVISVASGGSGGGHGLSSGPVDVNLRGKARTQLVKRRFTLARRPELYVTMRLIVQSGTRRWRHRRVMWWVQ